MKILGFEIGGNKGSEVDNVTKPIKDRVKVSTKVVKRELTQANQDVGKWRSASLVARSVTNPSRVQLHEIYRDVVLDSHLSSLYRTIKLKSTSGEFMICNADGTENEELTAKINVKWFREYMDHFVDSMFWGHSLIQLGGIENDEFIDLELINRDNVIPEFGMVKKQIGDDIAKGIPFRESPFREWVIEIGKPDDLGLLHKATPLVLWKKGVFGAWSHYAEMFGQPVRIGKTDILDPVMKTNMENMLKNMGGSHYAVLHPDDLIEFVNDNRYDAFRVYDQLIERINGELSKLILGQTGTTDEKTHVGSAGVHADVLTSYVYATKQAMATHFNKYVLPLMQYHGMIPNGVVGKWDNSEKMTTDQQFDMVSELLKHYTIPAEWINEKFNIPVEEKQQPTFEQSDDTVIPDVDNLYNGLIK